jgi:hypothetical protein
MAVLRPVLRNKIKNLDANINKSLFLVIEILKSSFSFKPKMKILFSVKPAWEKNIRIGFHTTRHELTFSEFTQESIINNDLLVPLTMRDLKYLSQHRSLLTNYLIPIPSLEAINICDDKYLFNQTLKEKGYGQYLPKVGCNLSYPYILKKRIAEDGDNCYIIANPDKEKDFENLIADTEYFCQEIIQGTTEFATHIIYKEGKILSALNIKYVFNENIPIKGKNKFIYRKICSCPHLDLFSDMLQSIEFEGLCCFNYKMIDSQPSILEINPRFGGSLSSFFFSFVRRLNLSQSPAATQETAVTVG